MPPAKMDASDAKFIGKLKTVMKCNFCTHFMWYRIQQHTHFINRCIRFSYMNT